MKIHLMGKEAVGSSVLLYQVNVNSFICNVLFIVKAGKGEGYGVTSGNLYSTTNCSYEQNITFTVLLRCIDFLKRNWLFTSQGNFPLALLMR